jgi:hypothetical protein
MSDKWAGIDVGGTKVLCVVVDGASGTVLASHKVKTGNVKTVEAVLGKVREAFAGAVSAAGGCSVEGVGLAVPGPVDSEKRFVHKAVNLGWHQVVVVVFKHTVVKTKKVGGFVAVCAGRAEGAVSVAGQRRKHGSVRRSHAGSRQGLQQLLRHFRRSLLLISRCSYTRFSPVFFCCVYYFNYDYVKRFWSWCWVLAQRRAW